MVNESSATVKRKELSFQPPTQEFLSALREADLVYVAAATTSPSISLRADAMSARAPSGDGVRTVGEYRRDYACGVNAVSRLRALAVSLPSGESAYIDLDQLAAAERVDIVRAVLGGVVVCAESASLLGYAVQIVPDLAPSLVLDLSILVRVLAPALPYRLNAMAAQDHEAAAGVLSARSYHPCSLQAVAMAMEIYEDLHAWPSGRGWTLGTLSSPEQPQQVLGTTSHTEALGARLTTTLRAFEALAGSEEPGQALANLAAMDAAGEFFGVFEAVPMVLARMHAKGLQISAEAVDQLEGEALASVEGLAAELLAAVPAMEPLREDLEAVALRSSDAVRQALGGYAASMGRPLPCDVRGVPRIGSDALVLHGADGMPGLVAWSELEAAKRAARAASDLRIHARPVAGDANGARRIHPLASVQALSGRLSCTAPNAQGFDESSKSAIEARAGHVLIEADFGAIEIRIAAAQASQVMKEAARVLAGDSPAPEWVRRALELGAGTAEVPRPWDRAPARDMLAYWYRQALRAGMPLVRLLAAGQCPHDYTGLGLAADAGMVDLGGIDRLEYLQTTARAEVRASICGKRKVAKVVNIGLLYRMGSRGLHEKGLLDGVAWTLQEATAARAAWFLQFPEIAFASEFVLAVHRDAESSTMSLPVRYGAGREIRDVCLYRSRTLGGREIVAHDDRLINLRAQGTGATIALKALVDLPSYLLDTLVMAVHDSVLIEVPEARAAWYASELARSMTASAAVYLEPWGVPAVVETKIGKTWGAML